MATALTIQNGSNYLAKKAQENAPSARFMKYKQGKYFIGNDEVPSGSRFIAAPQSVFEEYLCWEDGEIVDRHTAHVAKGEELPPRESLDRQDPEQWDVHLGEKSDPWVKTTNLPLFSLEDGDEVVLTSSTKGGTGAIWKLVNQQQNRAGIGKPAVVPVIELQTVQRHNRKINGPVNYPVLKPTGWRGEESPAEDPQDDIPF